MARVGSEIALVARAGELARLHEVWALAQQGMATTVLLPGDAGVGKTRLVTEFARSVESGGGLVLTGHCVGLGESAPPYLPLVEIVEQMRAVDPAVVADCPALESLVTVGRAAAGDDRANEQLQLFDAVLGALTTLAARRPVLLVVEDLHWSDPSTRDLLTFLTARFATQSLTAVLTYRSDELHRRHPVRPMLTELARMRRVERLELSPFGPEDARAFAWALAHDVGEDDERLVAEIAMRSEGNAFFAEELMANGSAGGAAITGALVDVLLGRIERLSPLAQRVIRAASVAGNRRVRHATLQAVLDISEAELEEALRECVQMHVLLACSDSSGSYEFRHALFREAVYADLLPGERTRLHAAYVTLLAELRLPGWQGAQAYHATRSGDLATALAASIGAAREAARVAATADALAHLENALSLWDAVPDPTAVSGTDELSLTVRASDAAMAAGRFERAESFIRSAMELADAGGDVVARASVRRRLAKILYASDHWHEAEQTSRDAWELIEHEPPSAEQAWVLGTLAFGKVTEERRVFAERAIEIARSVGEGGAEADALISYAYALLRDAEVEKSFAVLEQARDRAAQVGAHEVELRATFNLAVGTFELGRFADAIRHLDAGLARAAETGLTWATYGRELSWIAVHVHYANGTWDVVERLASPPGEQDPDWISGVLAASAALLHASRGEWDRFDVALDRLEPWILDDDEPQKIATFARAERDLWQQRPAAVAETVDAMVESVTRAGYSHPPLSLLHVGALGLMAQADIAARARQTRDARAASAAVDAGARLLALVEDAAERGVPRSATLGPEGLAWLARARAEASRLAGEHDPQPWRAAVEAFSYGDVYQAAMCRWRLADALLAGGDHDGGAAELITALATARSLRARPLEDALVALARRHRVDAPGVQRQVTDLLTPRERSVLELVAQGLTNRAVGDELFISEKTVSVHLTRVMAKLGAGSRTEAVAQAMQRGLIGAG